MKLNCAEKDDEIARTLIQNFPEFYPVTNERKHFRYYDDVLRGRTFRKVLAICGGGEAAVYISWLVKAEYVILIDLNPWQLELLKRKIAFIREASSYEEFCNLLMSQKDILGEYFKKFFKRELDIPKRYYKDFEKIYKENFDFWKSIFEEFSKKKVEFKVGDIFKENIKDFDLVHISNIIDWIRDQKDPRILYEEERGKVVELFKGAKAICGCGFYSVKDLVDICQEAKKRCIVSFEPGETEIEGVGIVKYQKYAFLAWS